MVKPSLKLAICLVALMATNLACCLAFIHHGNRSAEQFRNKSTISAIVNGIPSVERPFYVRIKSLASLNFCGGTILARYWIITAGHCLYGIDPMELVVEVGDFEVGDSRKAYHRVRNVFFAPGFTMSNPPENDIALIELTVAILDPYRRTLPLCMDNSNYDALLGSCGMGITSVSQMKMAETLEETYFREATFSRVELLTLVPCREDTVCTVPITDDTSICNFDEGGPLFRIFSCGNLLAECLYGIASYTTSNLMSADTETNWCNDGSFFARISLHRNWIFRMVRFF